MLEIYLHHDILVFRDVTSVNERDGKIVFYYDIVENDKQVQRQGNFDLNSIIGYTKKF